MDAQDDNEAQAAVPLENRCCDVNCCSEPVTSTDSTCHPCNGVERSCRTSISDLSECSIDIKCQTLSDNGTFITNDKNSILSDHYENCCKRVLSRSQGIPRSQICEQTEVVDGTAPSLESGDNIRDCSYVSVLGATNDQDQDCASNHLTTRRMKLSIDEIDCLCGALDESSNNRTMIECDIGGCGDEECKQHDILCECDLQMSTEPGMKYICNTVNVPSQESFSTEPDVDVKHMCHQSLPVESKTDGEDYQNDNVNHENSERVHKNSRTENNAKFDSLSNANIQESREDYDPCTFHTDVIYDSPTESSEVSNGQQSSVSDNLLQQKAVYEGDYQLDDEFESNVNCGSARNDDIINKNVNDNGSYHSPEDNIYEEIKRYGKNRSKESDAVDQTIFKRGSLVDEVMNEVERVEKGHAQILQELNLDIENLIMPNTPTSSFPMESNASLSLSPDLLQTLNADSTTLKSQLTNLSTRTLPPLPPNSADTVPLRSTPSCTNLYHTKSAPPTYQVPPTSAQPSSGVKHWLNRLSSLSSFRDKKSKLSSSESARWRLSLRASKDEPLYMLYDDSHRMHEAPKHEQEDGIYEDIDKISQTYTMPNMGNCSVQQVTSSYRDRQSASTVELTEDFSDTESVQSGGSLSVSSFKGKLLNFGRKLSRQYDEKGKEIKFKPKLSENDSKSDSKLTRLFSKKKGYDLSRTKEGNAVSSTIDDEKLPKLRMSMRQKSPALPPVPTGLNPDQVKRRYIIGTLVHSENSYIESLKKLVNDYKKPLEESSPPILSASKASTLFYRIPEILQCHINFCISLAACIRKWDKEEKLGDVFIQAFSKTSVLDIYSDYINNFSVAVDLAKQESKRKSAFTDFLKVKQITSQDRLSLFGLMVKPVQRFPQFILLLQDLLKHTPQGHNDRMALQLALTQMETLTDILNERKRESDQAHAVKDILRHVSAKSAARSLNEGSRYLLRQDSLTQLVFNQNGQWIKSKVCRLFLLNDLLVCVTVGLSSDRAEARKSERFTFKWSVPVSDIEIQEEASPILNNMVHAMSACQQTAQSPSTKSDNSNVAEEMEGVKYIYQELGDLLHDFEVMSRIMALVTTLKKSYPDMSKEVIQGLSHSIQQSIQKKDDEVKWIDSCCLQFTVPMKTKTGKVQRELMIFQSKSMDTKQEWLRDVRMSQLALDENNSPAWNIPESSKRFNTKTPLFVNSIPMLSSRHMTEVKCGCCHRTMSARLLGRRPLDYVWLCSTDGVNSYISIHTLRQKGLRDVYRFDMTECRISTMESVPGFESSSSNFNLIGDTIWMGTESRRVLVYSGSDVDHYQEVGNAVMLASVLQIKYHLNQVYVALANGSVACFRRDNYVWQMKDFQIITLSSEPVACLLPVYNSIFCGCGRKVWIVDCKTSKVVHSHLVHHDHIGSVYSMAHSGIGLWLNLRNTPLVCLYHAETFQHLQDVNISSSIRRILDEQNRPHSPRNYCVTTLTAILGLLWIGTNVGVVLSIPLPRLQGMPILGRRANMAYHANVGPVSIILELQSPSPLTHSFADSSEIYGKEKNVTNRISNLYKSDLTPNDDCLSQFNVAKTLPRGWKPSIAAAEDHECNVYGLYGNLINVREGTDNHIEDDLRRSDPDLIPNLVSTLDRRLRLHSGRPRSLDLANLANLMSGNDTSCVSSSSEDNGSGSQSFTELPECNVNVFSQIKESSESNENLDSCQIHEQKSQTLENPMSTTSPNSYYGKRLFSKKFPEQQIQRSVMTLIGGRGYIDLRKSTKNEQLIYESSTSTNAYAILWEMKV